MVLGGGGAGPDCLPKDLRDVFTLFPCPLLFHRPLTLPRLAGGVGAAVSDRHSIVLGTVCGCCGQRWVACKGLDNFHVSAGETAPRMPCERGSVVVYSVFVLELCDYALHFVSSMSLSNCHCFISVSVMFDALV